MLLYYPKCPLLSIRHVIIKYTLIESWVHVWILHTLKHSNKNIYHVRTPSGSAAEKIKNYS